MTHEHQVYDNDGYFILDPKSKTFKNESEKESIVQFDHKSEEIRFKFPKIIEGHDMSKVDLIQVHFDNTSTGTSVSLRTTNAAPVNITSTLKECDDDPEYWMCSWLIGEESTQLAGTLKFKLKFVCYGDNNTPAYKMNTLYYEKYQVLTSPDSAEGVIETYPDAIVSIEERLSNVEKLLEEGAGGVAQIGYEPPTISTPGKTGQIYLAIQLNKSYICVDSQNIGEEYEYYWVETSNPEIVTNLDYPENLTDEQVVSAKLLYDTAGNIEAVLDNIIATQNELIGGSE